VSSDAVWEVGGATIADSVRKDPNSVESKDQELDKLPFMEFALEVMATAKKGVDWVAKSQWLNWWPFLRHEQRLQRLFEDADANPRDAAKQTILLAELNKHRFSLVCFPFVLILSNCLIEAGIKDPIDA
jgi:hypothetical protein